MNQERVTQNEGASGRGMACASPAATLGVVGATTTGCARALVVVVALLATLPLLGGPDAAGAVRVFDCEAPEAKYMAVDLTEPAPCPDAVKEFQPPVNTTVQIIQTEATRPILAYQCLVTISKEVTRCGFDSITYGSIYTVFDQVQMVTPEECRNAIQTGQIILGARAFKVVPGEATTETFFSHGHVADNGYCETATFISGGQAFTRAYEQTRVKSQLRTVRGTVHSADGEVIFSNGLRAKVKDGMLRDSYEGTLIWQEEQGNCTDAISQVYYGPATVHRRAGNQDTRDDVGSIVMISNETTSQYAGLQLRGPQSVCRIHCFYTQISGITVCVLRALDQPLPEREFREKFEQTTTALQTQLSFLHMGTNMRMYERFERIQTDLCEVDRKVLHARLQSVAAGDSRYSLVDLYGPGHSLHVAGAVAYVTSCVEKEATLVAAENCTLEIPVSVQPNNTKRFADPMTWVLHDFPTVVPCDDLMPIRWKVHNDWYCATPNARPCEAPLQLQTSTTEFQAEDFTRGLGSGIYSREQRERHRQALMLAGARNAVVAKAAANAVATAPAAGVLGNLVSEGERQIMAIHIASLINPFFRAVGEWWSLAVGALVVLGIVQALVGWVIRTISLYKEKGCGLWLLAAVWQVTYHMVYVPARVVSAAANAVRDGYHRGQRGRERLVDETASDSFAYRSHPITREALRRSRGEPSGRERAVDDGDEYKRFQQLDSLERAYEKNQQIRRTAAAVDSAQFWRTGPGLAPPDYPDLDTMRRRMAQEALNRGATEAERELEARDAAAADEDQPPPANDHIGLNTLARHLYQGQDKGGQPPPV
jgi:hypothetical protein